MTRLRLHHNNTHCSTLNELTYYSRTTEMGIFFVIIILVHCGTSTSNYYENYLEAKLISKFELLTEHVSKVICSNDLKFISICFEMKSKSEMVDDLLRKALGCVPGAAISIIGIDPNHNDNNIETAGTHLIIVLLDDQRVGLSILRKMQSQRHLLYYIFIWDGEPPEEFKYFLSFLFQEYKILNAVAIVQKKSEREHRVYTYDPFDTKHLRIASNVYQREELFIEKDKNLFGYQLLITRYQSILNAFRPQTGLKSVRLNLDRFLPGVVAHVMNATLKLAQPYINEIDREQIANADLLLNGRYYEPALCNEFRIEPTNAVRRDDICILVPFKRFRPMLESIYRTLHPSVWMSAILAAFSTAMCFFMISKVERHWNRPIRLYLFGNYTKFSRGRSTRVILTSWLLYCVVISLVFQSALFKGLTLEGRDPMIKTIHDLNNSMYQILVTEVFYNSTIDVINNSSLKGIVKVVGVKEYLDYIYANNVEYAYVERYKRTNHFANIIDEDKLPVYYTMSECVCPQIGTYYVRIGSPFLNRINWIIEQSHENGLFNYWEERLYTPFNKRHRLFQRPKSGHLENLNFIFKYWFYALFVCFFGFIGELIVALLQQPL